jgi:ATP-binding cassette subfamily F protein uup
VVVPSPARATAAPRAAGPAAEPRGRRPGKRSFKEQRELEGMEAAILAAEERKSALEAALGDPATYQKDGAAVAGLKADLEQVTAEVERLYARWQELEAMGAG